MERLTTPRESGIPASMLRLWGFVLLTLGLVGRGILQTRILHVDDLSGNQMLEALSASPDAMAMATMSLVLRLAEACATPVFCFLLLEGFLHTRHFQSYFLRVLGLAVVSEIPYNLAISGSFLDLASRNPAFGMVLGLVLLYFYQRYDSWDLKNTGIKVAVTLAALVWSKMLGIYDGACVVIILMALWLFRDKPTARTFAGCGGAAMCIAFSPYYLASPIVFLLTHGYNGNPGQSPRWLNYAAYPGLLLLTALAAWALGL